MTTAIALLRGVNVGGKNKLPMADLTAILTAAGCTSVRTYIQSGNAVFDAGPAVLRRLPERVAAAILKQHALTVPVITRTADELQHLIEANPFLTSRNRLAPSCPSCLRGETLHLHVGFLADAPNPARVKALDPDRSPGDAFRIHAREIYLHLPHGVARSKLTNTWFDAALGTTSTFRNWRTVQKLVEMIGSPQ